jgi:hypothetical protein
MHLSVDGSIVYGVIIDAVLGTLLPQKLTHEKPSYEVKDTFEELCMWIRSWPAILAATDLISYTPQAHT